MKPSEPAVGSAHQSPADSLPAILLVEDDPTTLAFLRVITEALPARVDTATRVSEALRLAKAQPYALWLVDANLPDGSGAELLQALRQLHPETPALAHTAARGHDELQPLLAAGFAEVLVKPVDTAQWQASIRRHLGEATTATASMQEAASPEPDALAIWDDEAATAALGGNRAHVDALRGLFLAELPSQLHALRNGDADARRAQLHRMRASCAFVGAARLDAAVRALHDAPESEALLQRVLDTGADTMSQAAAPA